MATDLDAASALAPFRELEILFGSASGVHSVALVRKLQGVEYLLAGVLHCGPSKGNSTGQQPRGTQSASRRSKGAKPRS